MAADTQPTITDPVTEALDALIARLSEHALGGNFERGVRFRASAILLRDRWVAGEMPRASKTKEAV